MSNKVKYGQFYTKRSKYIIGNLLDIIPEDAIVVEPFCGEGDLLLLKNDFELYDIDPKISQCIKRDTLKNPPSYEGKWVITNPPFLAKNKNKDKSIYHKYSVGDLYKASIKTILGSEGGILIVPLNFLCDEDDKIRSEFFSKFDIVKLNIFEETVFDDTTYTICSFSFKKKAKDDDLRYIQSLFYPSMINKNLELKKTTGYRIGNDFLELISNQSNIGIKRLLKEGSPNSKILLRAIDSGSKEGRIGLSICESHFYGKDSDRSFATIILNRDYSLEEQKIICYKFNEILEFYRYKYNSMFLTNFRNSSNSYSRKRISFDVAYKLISYIIETQLDS